MDTRSVCKLAAMVICGLVLSSNATAIPGDADGSGVVDMDDARAIARYVLGGLGALPNAPDADATQGGTVDMQDAFAIATRLTGQSRILEVAPRHGHADALQVG